MGFESLVQFYNSEEWHKLRLRLIDERTNKADSVCRCEQCGKAFKAGYEIIGHHKIPITKANVNDYSLSLNPANITLVCGVCHNEIHKRFGYSTERKVYYVYGAPCSGKTSYINSIKGNSDLIIDMDNIWECITGGDRYFKPNALKLNAFAVRDLLLDMVKTRAGKWERAFIIEGGARKAERERKLLLYGAEPIHIDTDYETCLSRLYNDKRRVSLADEWQKYIENYFREYQE